MSSQAERFDKRTAHRRFFSFSQRSLVVLKSRPPNKSDGKYVMKIRPFAVPGRCRVMPQPAIVAVGPCGIAFNSSFAQLLSEEHCRPRLHKDASPLFACSHSGEAHGLGRASHRQARYANTEGLRHKQRDKPTTKRPSRYRKLLKTWWS